LKILYVTTISNTINAFLIPHIKLLIEQGHQVDIAFNIVQKVSPELTKLGCKIHNVEFQRSPLNKKNIIAYKKIKKIIREEGYDLVHTHTPVASFLTRVACRKISNIQVLYTAHGFHFFKGAALVNWLLFYNLEKMAVRWTDGLITINQEDYEIAKKMTRNKKTSIHLIPGTGINLDKFNNITNEEKLHLRKKFELKQNDFLLIYAAELNKNKNQSFLIEGMAQLKEKYPNIKLLLAGDGILKENYIEYSQKLKTENNVIFLGYRKDIDKIIPMCDVGVSSSMREGFGINLIEYLSCGLPVIASKNRGHKEIITNSYNGFLFDYYNLNEFINIIEKLYKDEIHRGKISCNTLESIQNFSIESSQKAMNQIYKLYI
jgi:glycosyltransferase EpsD